MFVFCVRSKSGSNLHTHLSYFVMQRAIGIFVVGLALLGSVSESTGHPRSADSLSTLRSGIAHVSAGRIPEALEQLGPLMQRHPRLADDAQGTLGYWLGRAHAARGDTVVARRVWYTALQAAASEGHTAVDAADALLASYAPEQIADAATVLVPAFLHVVESFGRSVTQPEAQIREQYAARLALVLPPSLGRRVHCADSSCPAPTGTEREDVLRWWRARDPLPSTAVHEGLVTHLERVATARREFAWSGRPTGLDERGELYVRLGPPDEVRRLVYRPERPYLFLKILIDAGVSRHDVPPQNEIWLYPRIDPDVHFLFARAHVAGRPFQNGTLYDLLPATLQSIRGAQNERNRVRLRAALSVLKMYYEQLIDLGSYGTRYGHIVNYINDPGHVRIGVFAERHVRLSTDLDAQAERYRSSVVSRHRMAWNDAHSALPMAVRTARFLETDGSTRLESYWSVPADALIPSEAWQQRFLHETSGTLGGQYRLHSHVTVYDADYEVVARVEDTVSVAPVDVTGGGWISGRRRAVTGLRGTFHVASKWNQYATQPGSAPSDDGTLVSFTQHRADSVRALRPDPQHLEVSDLLPASVASVDADNPLSVEAIRKRVAAHDRVDGGRLLALTFEIYHLTYDTDDRTRYTIAYEVNRAQQWGGLRGLFGGTDEERTETAARYRGTSRTEPSFVVLELPSWNVTRPTPVDVTVRVTDEVTGGTVERSLSFTVVPPEQER